eukprot:1179339-Amphidinium_carterae.1
MALRFASASLKADREIALIAAENFRQNCFFPLRFVDEALLADNSFVAEVKKSPKAALKDQVFFLKITMLSGQSTMVLCDADNHVPTAPYAIEVCCQKFGFPYTRNEVLIQGTEEVPLHGSAFNWPGIQRPGGHRGRSLVHQRLSPLTAVPLALEIGTVSGLRLAQSSHPLDGIQVRALQAIQLQIAQRIIFAAFLLAVLCAA